MLLVQNSLFLFPSFHCNSTGKHCPGFYCRFNHTAGWIIASLQDQGFKTWQNKQTEMSGCVKKLTEINDVVLAPRLPSLRSPWPSAVISTPWSRGCRRRSTPATWPRRTSSWSWPEAGRPWRCGKQHAIDLKWALSDSTREQVHVCVCVCFQTLKGLCLDSKRSKVLQRLELSLDILGGTVERISNTAEVLGAVHQVHWGCSAPILCLDGSVGCLALGQGPPKKESQNTSRGSRND